MCYCLVPCHKYFWMYVKRIYRALHWKGPIFWLNIIGAVGRKFFMHISYGNICINTYFTHILLFDISKYFVLNAPIMLKQNIGPFLDEGSYILSLHTAETLYVFYLALVVTELGRCCQLHPCISPGVLLVTDWWLIQNSRSKFHSEYLIVFNIRFGYFLMEWDDFP